MKKITLGLIGISALIVSACTVGKPVGNGGDGRSGFPDGYSLFEVGRSVSNNAVDIFDPWLTTFDLPPNSDISEYTDPLRHYPENGYILVADRSVTVFALDSQNVAKEEVVEDIIQPVPLIEEELLPP